ncbi:MAG: pseudouridine-5'-phosphate glycosidase [Saprospiraceae bacterium]|nr:pseudouridine-5'-phosphate glycosidase [Saprospiraceae bacterium]
MKNPFLELTPSVLAAIQDGAPVVALESTIIAHGMPYPQNVETALLVEETVRQNGATPATIALINGKMKAGLTTDDIEILGKSGSHITKVSRRDLPAVIAKNQHGATTVASTMIVAALAGIRIFATGGIGGVHRGAHETFDISADLLELAQTSVAVVSAGAKSILDLGLTLEYLETQGVPVIGFQTDEFPAFFTRSSGFGVDFRVDTEGVLADILHAKWQIPLEGGVLIANPVPSEFEADKKMIDKAIDRALRAATEQGIKGKQITPFLLAEIERMTEGLSLKTNIQLVLNNAALGARVAKAYCSKAQ